MKAIRLAFFPICNFTNNLLSHAIFFGETPSYGFFNYSTKSIQIKSAKTKGLYCYNMNSYWYFQISKSHAPRQVKNYYKGIYFSWKLKYRRWYRQNLVAYTGLISPKSHTIPWYNKLEQETWVPKIISIYIFGRAVAGSAGTSALAWKREKTSSKLIIVLRLSDIVSPNLIIAIKSKTF